MAFLALLLLPVVWLLASSFRIQAVVVGALLVSIKTLFLRPAIISGIGQGGLDEEFSVLTGAQRAQ